MPSPQNKAVSQRSRGRRSPHQRSPVSKLAMKSNAVRLVTKMPCRLQKTNEGLTARRSAVAAAASGPPSRQATRQVSSNVSAAMSSGNPRSATTFTPPSARNGVASNTFRLPM